jgi:formylmethanofuran dehydrogenase subunit E
MLISVRYIRGKIMPKTANPREQIEKYVKEGNLKALLNKAAEIHGHYCTFLALGVKATYLAFKELDIMENPGMEELMVITECNNCFIDGIQALSGCTLGNNAMIYKDLGKTAATFWPRAKNKALRIVVKPYDEIQSTCPEAQEMASLFDRRVKKREELSPEENKRFYELSTLLSFQMLDRPIDEIFKTEWIEPEKLEYAPIYDSMICSRCGESVMESHVRLREGKPYCLNCCSIEYFMVAGRGIHCGR